MTEQTISHYRLRSKIGEGAMGVVYKAEDLYLNRTVAIKMLRPETAPLNPNLRARLKREALTISRLSHQNIATVYEYGETDEGQPYLVMELVGGKTLAEIIRSNELSTEGRIQIIKSVAEALAEAHRHGIIHRDIKPSNIALDQRGAVKVLDFGLAKQVSGADEEAGNSQHPAETETRDGVILGTPYYLSPEQALGAAVDRRSDLFSLGCVLFECLTGRPPFLGGSSIEVCAKIIRDEPSPPSQINPLVSPLLDQLVLKALEKKPENRFQSAEEFINALNTLDNHLDSAQTAEQNKETKPFRTPPALRKTSFQNTLHRLYPGTGQNFRYLYIGACVLLIAGILGWMILKGRDFSRQPSDAIKISYEEGLQYLLAGDYLKARDKLKQTVETDPDFIPARLRLAETLWELNDAGEAAGELARLQQENSRLGPIEKARLRAMLNTTSNNFAAAAADLEEIERLNPDSDSGQLLFDLAGAYEKSEQIDKAVNCLQRAVGESRQPAPAYLRLGIIYARKQNVAGSMEYFEKAKNIYQSLKNLTGVTAVLYQQGTMYAGLNRTIEARAKLQQAVDVARADQSQYFYIRSLLALSSVAATEKNLAEAQHYAGEAFSLAENNNLRGLTIQSLHALGKIASAGREFDVAEKYFGQALDSARSNNNQQPEAELRVSLANLYEQRGNPEAVIEQIQPALDFYRQASFHKQSLKCLLLYGRVSLQRSDFSKAFAAFKEAVEIASRTEDPTQIIKAHFEIGNLLATREFLPEALVHFDEVASLSAAASEPVIISYSLLYRSQIQWRLGRYSEAEATLAQMSETVALLDKNNRQVLTARINLNRAQMELSRLNFPQAVRAARAALEGFKDPYGKTESSYTLCSALAFAGQKKEAGDLCRQAVTAAAEVNDTKLQYPAWLALAETKLKGRKAVETLEIIDQWAEKMGTNNLGEIQWRAYAVAARAARLLGKDDKMQFYRNRGKEILTGISQTWNGNNYQGYLSRPDIKNYLNYLDG